MEKVESNRWKLLPDVESSRALLACSSRLPFGPCNQQHFLNWLDLKKQWKEFLQEIVAKLQFLATMHLQLVGKIAANCRYPSTADLLEAPNGSLLSEWFQIQEQEVS